MGSWRLWRRRGRLHRRIHGGAPWLLVFGALALTPLALMGSNVVAGSSADQYATSAGPNDVKPLDCSSLTLSALYKGAGDVTGGSTNDLVLGGSSAQTLAGGAGDDCILGGDGNDVLQGGAGNDVCIGGPGEDTFVDCETTVQGDATF